MLGSSWRFTNFTQLLLYYNNNTCNILLLPFALISSYSNNHSLIIYFPLLYYETKVNRSSSVQILKFVVTSVYRAVLCKWNLGLDFCTFLNLTKFCLAKKMLFIHNAPSFPRWILIRKLWSGLYPCPSVVRMLQSFVYISLPSALWIKRLF